MDPYEIEDTSDWLGTPTQFETCRHQLLTYENEIQELTAQLRQNRERTFKLVEMHAEAAKEVDHLRSQLSAAKSEVADASRRAVNIETKSN